MAEGYSKGRDQYAKEQRQAFETNQKALRGTLDSLEKAFTLELEQNKNDLESATRNAKIAALQRDAGFINANIDKYGLVSTLEQLRSNKKRLETVLGALQKKEDAYSAEMQKEWFANESKKATAAAAQERVRYEQQERAAREQERREDQERRDKERRQDRLSDITRSENFQKEMFNLRKELKSGQKEDDDRLKMGAVEGRTLRDTRKLQNDMSNLIDDLQSPTLIKQINDNRAQAFLSEESKVVDQLLSQKLPPELQAFLLKVKSIRNKTYLDTSGKTVTGGEALRAYGVVAQPGDTAERARQKLELGISDVEESIKDFQKLYKIPQGMQERLGEARIEFATMEDYEKAKKGLKDGQKVKVAGRNAVHQSEK
jgi:Tfp pilus assembly protein PilE